jgi:hypothetical protein
LISPPGSSSFVLAVCRPVRASKAELAGEDRSYLHAATPLCEMQPSKQRMEMSSLENWNTEHESNQISAEIQRRCAACFSCSSRWATFLPTPPLGPSAPIGIMGLEAKDVFWELLGRISIYAAYLFRRFQQKREIRPRCYLGS